MKAVNDDAKIRLNLLFWGYIFIYNLREIKPLVRNKTFSDGKNMGRPYTSVIRLFMHHSLAQDQHTQ